MFCQNYDKKIRHWQKLVSFYIKKASKKYRSFQEKKSAAEAKIILTRGNLKSVAYSELMFIFIPDLGKGKKINRKKRIKIRRLPDPFFGDTSRDILGNIFGDILRDISKDNQNQR